jgi:hypothetical protein
MQLASRALFLAIALAGCTHFQRKHYIYEAAQETTLTEAKFDWITVPLRAFTVRNDDGSRPCDVTPEEIAIWVEEANRVFVPAKIRFELDPALVEPLNSTLVNESTDDSNPKWRELLTRGDALAAGYEGRVVVFFRHGPSAKPSGNGFAGPDYRFVVMPSLQGRAFCGHANLTLLAHELGHHLGLAHTFPEVFSSVWAAEDAHEKDPQYLDGDAISDTLLEPFFRDEEFECNLQVNAVRLNDQALRLPRHNVMSYLDSPQKTLSAEQILIVRQGALRRTGQDIRRVLEGEFLPPIEGHVAIDFAETTHGTLEVQPMRDFWGTWSEDSQLFWVGAQLGSALTLPIRVEAAGRYELWGVFTRAPDYAEISASIDEAPLIQRLDLYARGVNHTPPVLLGAASLTSGEHRLRFEITGRNPRSTGFLFGFDYLLLKAAEPPRL